VSEYEVFAIRYARLESRPAAANFLGGGDEHDGPLPLDYFVWAIRGDDGRTIVVDTGFSEEMAARRGRIVRRPVAEGLKAIGVDPATVEDVVITHMHYDHAGNHGILPNARYHIQEREMAYCTGKCMCHPILNHVYEPEDIGEMVRKTFAGRVAFHDGSADLADGVSVHLVGGHTRGLQVVRVRTRRGWVVLASDASHYYANVERPHPFPVVIDVEDMLEGYATMRRLASSIDHIVPGHDPAVLTRYAGDPGGPPDVVRLDIDPVR
jgi:glyoxylase-like metal-dependent hydrolase (beta-lactamase superfamily II)